MDLLPEAIAKSDSFGNSTFTEKVMIGLKKALRKLAEEAASNNESLIIGDKEGHVKSIPAKELLKGLSK